MRIPLTVTIIAIAMLVSQVAYGQAASDKGQIGTQGTNGKPSGPAEGKGDSTLIPPKQPAIAPPSDSPMCQATHRRRHPRRRKRQLLLSQKPSRNRALAS